MDSRFVDKTLLITGVTGFIGKVVLARMLALCPDVRRIYVLIRDRATAGFDARFEKEGSCLSTCVLSESICDLSSPVACIFVSVVASEAFEGLREQLRRKVVAVRGNALHAGATHGAQCCGVLRRKTLSLTSLWPHSHVRRAGDRSQASRTVRRSRTRH